MPACHERRLGAIGVTNSPTLWCTLPVRHTRVEGPCVYRSTESLHHSKRLRMSGTDVSCLWPVFLFISVCAASLLASRLSEKFKEWAVGIGLLLTHPKVTIVLRICMGIFSLVLLIEAGFGYSIPSQTAWSVSPPSLQNCLPLFLATRSFVAETKNTVALYSFVHSYTKGIFSRVRLCSDSPPAVIDSYFGSLITDDLYSSDRDNFCDAKDCLPLNKCTLQQIADACRISPKSNYSHTCHHLLTQTAPLPNGFLWKSYVSALPEAGCSLEFDVDMYLESVPCPYAFVHTLSRRSSADAVIAVNVLSFFTGALSVIAMCAIASSDQSIKTWAMETRVSGDLFTVYILIRAMFKGEDVPTAPPHPCGHMFLLALDVLEMVVIPWFYIASCPACSYSREVIFVFFKSIKIIYDLYGVLVRSCGLSKVSPSN